MFNKQSTPANIVVDSMTTEQVENNIYLGRTIMHNGNLLPAVKRIKLRWAAFGKVDNMSRSASMTIKEKIFNEYVLLVITYGGETWALKKATEEMITVA